ncbi:hypothetical protein [Pleomorphochaeta sp. DL1XJH-081]|uniref:hypothetical protein n=1 Tax=Pleomorphochaeta sp. DL1XJH-081 TaxID=3409690 RepID=UPI003BB511ED
MRKRTIVVLSIILIAVSPIMAFDGFTDIFGEEPVVESAIETTNPLTIAGTVGFSIEAFRGDDEPFKGETTIGGGLDLDLSWNGSIVDARTTLALHPAPDASMEWIDIFTGLSLTAFYDGGYVEAGLLKKEWGSADGVHVVDVLNAPDYRNGIVDDTNAMKMAEPMVSTTRTWGDTSLEVVYKPMLIPMVAADEPDDRWFMMSEAQYNALKTLFGGVNPEIIQPSPEELGKLTNWQIGGRLKSIVGPADLGLIYYNGFLYQPSYRIVAPPEIELEFTRAQLFGAEATMVAGPFTFMVEGGFWLSEDHDGTDPYTYNSKAVYLGGIGFMIPGLGAYTSVTYHGHYVLDFQEVPGDADFSQASQSSNGKPYMNTITAALELPLAREKVTVRLAGTYQLETGGYAVLPSVTWNVTDDFIFNATGRLFGALGPSADSLFATWAKNDALKLGISYVF